MKAVPGSQLEADYSSKHTKQQDNMVSQHNAQSKAWQSMVNYMEGIGVGAVFVDTLMLQSMLLYTDGTAMQYMSAGLTG